MVKHFYRGLDTYVIFKEETSFGVVEAPAGSSYVDKVTSFTGNMANNLVRIQGLGDGRNATSIVNGGLDVTGSMSWFLTDPDFLKYCILGTVTGAGTDPDPYKINEASQVGYTTGEIPTITIEVGSKVQDGNDDVVQYNGIVINNFTLNAVQGEVINCSADWIGQSATSSTTTESYTGPANVPFTFIEGELETNDVVGEVMSFSMTCNNNMQVFKKLSSRKISKPVAGVRRYEMTFTVKHHYDDSGDTTTQTLRSQFFDGTESSTEPNQYSSNTSQSLNFNLYENGGSGSGSRVVTFNFEDFYLESVSEPFNIDEANATAEFTYTGYALAGLTDGSNKAPIRWYTVA